MEDLNKQQFILLIILVSFVISFATGVTTVSLLQDSSSSPTITKTINRVIDRTVERVVSHDIEGDPELDTEKAEDTEPEIITQIVEREVLVPTEVVTYISDEDRRIQATTRGLASTQLIYDSAGLVGAAVIVDNDGSLLIPSHLVDKRTTYRVSPDSDSLTYRLDKETEDLPIATLRLNVETDTIFVPASFGDDVIVQVNQSLIHLTGQQEVEVYNGSVQSVDATDAGVVEVIYTSLEHANRLPGSIIVDLSGNVLGMYVPGISINGFTPASRIMQYIQTSEVEEVVEEE